MQQKAKQKQSKKKDSSTTKKNKSVAKLKTKKDIISSKIRQKSEMYQKTVIQGLNVFWVSLKTECKKVWNFLREYVFHYSYPIGFLFLFFYYITIYPLIKVFSFLYNLMFPPKFRKFMDKLFKEKILPATIKTALILLAALFTLVSAFGKLSLVIFDIFVPRGLRELVPLLQMYRKYALTAANIISGKKSKEIIQVTQELDEIVLREQRMVKNYPIRRAFGEVINVAIGTPLIIIAIPTIIVRIFRIGYAIFFYTFGQFSTLGPLGPPNLLKYLDLLNLFEYWFNLKPIWTITLFGTGLLVVSWIATIFGPIYALFHQCSLYLMGWGAYRWANIYRRAENIFSLPYHAAKSSFSFFDAPPVSTETLVDFRLEIKEEVDSMKDKVQELLALDSKNVPERSKENLEKLLSEAELSLNELDISKITTQTARTFALLIWSKEASILPWVKDSANVKFAKENEMSVKEVKKSLKLILKKIEQGYLSYDLFASVLITGALKGVAKQQDKYQQLMPDIEYNKLSISLALGAQQYIKDEYAKKPWYERMGKDIGISLIAPLMPIVIMFYSIFFYFRHVIISSIRAIIILGTARVGRFFSQRFKEISETLTSTYENVTEKGITFSFRRDMNIDFSEIFKKTLIFLIKLIPMIIWLFLKGIYGFVSRIWTRKTEEEKMKERFEKELTTQSLVAMYKEIYEKMLLTELLIAE